MFLYDLVTPPFPRNIPQSQPKNLELDIASMPPNALGAIFDLRLSIVDLSNCAQSTPRKQFENRQSKFGNSAA
jgi:hypothetical protein